MSYLITNENAKTHVLRLDKPRKWSVWNVYLKKIFLLCTCLTSSVLAAGLICFGGFVVCDSSDESRLVLRWFAFLGLFRLLGFTGFSGLFLLFGWFFLHWFRWRFGLFWFLRRKLWSVFNICPHCVLQTQSRLKRYKHDTCQKYTVSMTQFTKPFIF